jgi:hypothetical protein
MGGVKLVKFHSGIERTSEDITKELYIKRSYYKISQMVLGFEGFSGTTRTVV